MKLSLAVDDLRIKEAEIMSSLVSLDKFKTFLEKKEKGQLTEEDLANKEDLIMREALLEYAFKSSRFNRIQEELLLKNQENQKLQKDLIEKKRRKSN